MSINIVFKNLDRSGSLVEFIESQTNKIKTFLDPNDRLTYYVEKLSNGLKVSLQLDHYGKHFQAAAVKSNAYDGTMNVVKKVRRQLSEQKY